MKQIFKKLFVNTVIADHKLIDPKQVHRVPVHVLIVSWVITNPVVNAQQDDFGKDLGKSRLDGVRYLELCAKHYQKKPAAMLA